MMKLWVTLGVIAVTTEVAARERVNFDFGYVKDLARCACATPFQHTHFLSTHAARPSAQDYTRARRRRATTDAVHTMQRARARTPSTPTLPAHTSRHFPSHSDLTPPSFYSWRHKLGNNTPPPSPSPYPSPAPPPPPVHCSSGVEVGYNWGSGGSSKKVANATECCTLCNADRTCGCWDFVPTPDPKHPTENCWVCPEN